MIQSIRIAYLVLGVFFIGACGPDTIFLRPHLDTPSQHVKNGHSLLERGKIDAAHNEFERAMDLNEDYAPAYVGLALVKGYRGDVDGGYEILEKARKLAATPDDTKAVDRAYQLLRAITPTDRP